MSKIYGIYAGGHNSSCTLIEDGQIKFSIEEERLSRIKSGYVHESYPDLCINKLETESNITISDADYLICVDPTPPVYSKSFNRPYETISHHTAHNYASYFLSGMEGKVLSISYDGGGESCFMKVFLCEDGKMIEVHKLSTKNSGSLAHLWGFVTNWIMGRDENCQFKWICLKDEGKVMGMAPNGKYDPKIQKIFESILSYKDLHFYPSGTDQKTKFVMEVLLENGFFDTQEKIEDFSYNLQHFTEKLMLNFINDLHDKFPDYKKLCFSGGLFSNVKLNQRINEIDWVEEIFVCPPMGDEGLSLGGCIYKSVQLGEITKPFKLKNVFFGVEYSENQISSFLENFNFIKSEYIPTEIAHDINNGKIIGWFQDRMEIGPRSLGARSILVRPTDVSTHGFLNSRLNRHDTMPFAPMVLSEFFEELFDNPKSKYAAEFMTVTYLTKKKWLDTIPAVIQKSDSTARPQVVNKEKLPKVWNLIHEYYKISGIPVVLNTSFNIHNEPIIENPLHAFTHLKNGIIDKLVIGDYVYENK